MNILLFYAAFKLCCAKQYLNKIIVIISGEIIFFNDYNEKKSLTHVKHFIFLDTKKDINCKNNERRIKFKKMFFKNKKT
jgi:SHS2 domain-containing protein